MSAEAKDNSSKIPLDARSSVSSISSEINMCNNCKCRLAIIKRLKELFTELESCSILEGIKDEPLDEDEVIPLITYPITPEFDDSYKKKKDNYNEKYPPWKLPRFPSQELIGGRLCNTCECRKRNGLQDYCQRSMCRGSLQCLHKPDPLCIPSGMWRKCVQPEEANQIVNSLARIEEIGVDEGGEQGQQMPCSKCGHMVCKCRNKQTNATQIKSPINEGKKAIVNTVDAANKRCNKRDIKWDDDEKICSDYIPSKESPNLINKQKEQPGNLSRGSITDSIKLKKKRH